jgi:hypothetical protein
LSELIQSCLFEINGGRFLASLVKTSSKNRARL